jgi:small subunit ribosomal protein S16
MPATIRLQRVGRKKQSSFRIVVTEKTLARGGPALEILGTYNPRTEPSSIRFDAARALHWLRAGALPSDSVESIFRKTGVMKQFRSGVEPESLTETLITVGSPFGGGKTSQRGKHGGPPSPEKVAAEAAVAASAAADAAVEDVVEEVVEDAPVEDVVEEATEEAVEEAVEEAAVEAEAEEVAAEAEEVVADVDEAVEEVTAEAEAEVEAVAEEVEEAEAAEAADADEEAEKEGS